MKKPKKAEVSVPSELLEAVEKLIAERPELGFLDREEVIREALRLFLCAPTPQGSSGRSCSR